MSPVISVSVSPPRLSVVIIDGLILVSQSLSWFTIFLGPSLLHAASATPMFGARAAGLETTWHVSGLALAIVGAVSFSAGMVSTGYDTMSPVDTVQQTNISLHDLEAADTALQPSVSAHQVLAAVAVGMAANEHVRLDVETLVPAPAPAGDHLALVQLHHGVPVVPPDHQRVPLTQGHRLR